LRLQALPLINGRKEDWEEGAGETEGQRWFPAAANPSQVWPGIALLTCLLEECLILGLTVHKLTNPQARGYFSFLLTLRGPYNGAKYPFLPCFMML
jgi:hypothetical protein